ncbi:unnamed protein product [Staurois parvus]|uniref:Uncharacterized protein n=1 Tax=Staurois parvus TaxID=386267 RepID=A0ABN9FH09_9NEOB|nr:unnamed protein product [Staurois parvus]
MYQPQLYAPNQYMPCEEEDEDAFVKDIEPVQGSQYLTTWKKERNRGNLRMTTSGGIPPGRVPTRQDFTNYARSSKEVERQKNPTMGLIDSNISASSLIKTIDTFDRPADAYAEDTYARAGTYATGFIDKPGERIPKAGVYAEAGVGRAGAEFSIFEAKAKGPNASAGAEASVVGAGAMARAEVGSVSVGAGPFTAKLGLGVDTGAAVGIDGIEVKFLGTRVQSRAKIWHFYIGQ